MAVPNRRWVQVTVLSNPDTGLPANDVHYWGVEIGESLTPTATRAVVNPQDEIDARNRPHSTFNRVPVATNSAYAVANAPDAKYDYDKSSTVNPADEVIARNNPASSLNALLLITPP